MNGPLKIAIATVTTLSFLAAAASDVAMLKNGYSIQHERREAMGANTRLYFGSGQDGYVDVPTNQIEAIESVPAPLPEIKAPPKSAELAELVNSASGHQQIDADLINSLIRVESGFNPRAVSPKGAQGLMQLMPQTASRLGVTDSFDPAANIEGGTRYLNELLKLYNFDLIKALAAYNAGPQRVAQYHGVPPYRETQAYVARIVRDFNRKKLAERKASRKATANPVPRAMTLTAR